MDTCQTKSYAALLSLRHLLDSKIRALIEKLTEVHRQIEVHPDNPKNQA
jgi:hypothetical protein